MEWEHNRCICGDQKVEVVEVKLLIQAEGKESLEW